jgi:HAD superfamily hydrolase (TIGR01509 family)
MSPIATIRTHPIILAGKKEAAMASPVRPSVCLLDAEGTLFEPVPSLLEQLHVAALSLAPVSRAGIVRAYSCLLTELWPGDHSTAAARLEIWTRFCVAIIGEACGADARIPGAAVARRIVAPSGYRLFEETTAALDALTDAGVRLCVVSNFDDLLTDILKQLGIANRFDHVLTSFAVGVRKPDAGIFAEALRRMHVPATHAIFVGDSPYSDVFGARQAGIRAILVDRPGFHVRTEKQRISRLTEILPLFVETGAIFDAR